MSVREQYRKSRAARTGRRLLFRYRERGLGSRFLILIFFLCVFPATSGTAAEPQAGSNPQPVSSSQSVEAPGPGAAEPAPSPRGDRIAFSYAGDLWSVGGFGGVPTRLTVDARDDSNPVWSPRGDLIAFSRRDGGQTDVWTVEIATGEEHRLTRHTADETPTAFDRSGRFVFFHGSRSGEERVHRVGARGGVIEEWISAPSREAVVLEDGSMVYTSGQFPWWRRGARQTGSSDLYLVNAERTRARQLTSFEGPDLWACPVDGGIIYASESSYQRNLWKLALDSEESEQVTLHRDAPILFPKSTADGRLVFYEVDGRIWRRSAWPNIDEPVPVPIDLPIPDPWRHISHSSTPESIQSVVGGRILSPAQRSQDAAIRVAGEQVWLQVDGDLFLGAAHTDSSLQRLRPIALSGFLEGQPALDPQGRFAVFVSDRDGQRDLYWRTPGESDRDDIQLFRESAWTDERPSVSADGRFVSFVRGFEGEELHLAETSGQRTMRLLRTSEVGAHRFSPDGRWLAAALKNEKGNWEIQVVSMFGSGTYNLTLHPGRDFDPRWSDDGRWLYFRSDRAGSVDVWRIPLSNSEPADDGWIGIDLPGIALRAEQVTSMYGDEGAYSLRNDDLFVVSDVLGSSRLWNWNTGRPSLVDPEMEPLDMVEADGELWVLDRDLRVHRIDESGVVHPWHWSATGIRDERERRRSVLLEAWTVLRDQFYSDHLHLANWEEIRGRFVARLPGVHSAGALSRLIEEMMGELNASHLGVRPEPVVPVGRLGLETSDVDGRLVVHSVLAGGPADLAGLRPGDPLFAVDGEVVDAGRALEVQVDLHPGELVEIVWQSPPGGRRTGRGSDSDLDADPLQAVEERRAVVRPVPDAAIRALEFENRSRILKDSVRNDSNAKVAYVALSGIDRANLDRLQREISTLQPDRAGLILDLRNNPGGDLPEEFLRRLLTAPVLWRQPRGEGRHPVPRGELPARVAVLVGPKTGSAAEIVAQGLQEANRAIIVGSPSSGSVIGTDEVRLGNGIQLRVPKVGWYTKEGDNMEGLGVRPDRVVAEDPNPLRPREDFALEEALKWILHSGPEASGRD